MGTPDDRALKLVFRTVAREMLMRHDRAHAVDVDDNPTAREEEKKHRADCSICKLIDENRVAFTKYLARRP